MVKKKNSSGKKEFDDSFLVLLVALAIVITVGGFVLNLALLGAGSTLTGMATGTADVNFTLTGAVGVTLATDSINFGDGYYNSSCTQQYMSFHSGLNETGLYSPDNISILGAEPFCWINETRFLQGGNVSHNLTNSGTTIANLSVIGSFSGGDLFCGQGESCVGEADSKIEIMAMENEVGACDSNRADAYVTMGTQTANDTVTLCDQFDFSSDQNELYTAFNFTVPKGASSETKNYIVTYEVLAA